MALPSSVLAAGWIPFVVVLVLILLFSFVYVRYFQSKYDSQVCSTLTSVLGLAVALLTCALIPVDIFLVCYMKDSDGHFKDWAANKTDRQSMENGVLYAYYALYTCVLIFVFFILPFSYFFYEEGDEETTTKSKVCTALKYSIVFVLFAAVLILIGAFVPFRERSSDNSTEWEDKIKNIIDELGKNHGEDALSFSISSLTLVGMLSMIVYTASGMSAWPMDLIKGRRNVKKEQMDVVSERSEISDRIKEIRKKYRRGRTMSSRDRREVEQLEERDELIDRRERHLEAADNSCLRKCLLCLRPFQIIIGVFCLLLAVLVFISLLLTNIDKIMHSLGPHMGYALPEKTLVNPIDITLVFAQKVFPVDYILMTGIIVYFLFCSMGGIQNIGIWFCWLRMYKIRPRRTRPQGLLFLCFLLMFIVLALNVLVYQITPQYSTYGSQLYVDRNSSHLIACSTKAPPDECVMTRMSMLLTRFFYKLWFFGAAYYWASWVFLGVFVIGFIVAVVRKRRSTIEGEVDSEDFENSDEEILAA